MVATSKTRPAIQTSFATNLADNTTKDITPADVRGEIEDLSESAHIHESDRWVFTDVAGTTTTSSTLASVMVVTTSGTLPAATYLVDLSFQWKHALATSQIHFELTLDATNVAGQALVFLATPQGVTDWHHFGGRVGTFALGVAGTVDISLKFKSVDNTTLSSVRDVVLVLTKIASAAANLEAF